MAGTAVRSPRGTTSAPGRAPAPAVVSGRATAADLLAAPADGVRRELVDGEVRETAPAGFGHGRVALNAGAVLREFVRARASGVVVAAETGFRLRRDPDTVQAPDAAFVAADRLPDPEDQRGFLELAPDLVVEVVSPSDRAEDVVQMARSWLAAGSRLVWVAHPQLRLVVVHRPDGTATEVPVDGRLDGADVLPGFDVAVAELFD